MSYPWYWSAAFRTWLGMCRHGEPFGTIHTFNAIHGYALARKAKEKGAGVKYSGDTCPPRYTFSSLPSA